MELNILVGGAAGQGMETIMNLLGKVLLREGYNLLASKDYMSRVRGGHNFSRLRISPSTPWTHLETIDILVALNEETYFNHRDNLNPRGSIVYDTDYFSLEGENRGIGIPLQTLAREAGAVVMSNSVAAGALLGLLGLDTGKAEEIIREIFADKKEKISENNIKALKMGFEEASKQCEDCYPLPSPDISSKRLYVDGNQVLGMSALASGCRFLSAYPMTPSTGIMNYLAGKSLQHDIIVEQAEDEIAAINMALGASYAGLRSLTVTSGGGFSLMVEGLSLAGMTETPVVIILAMRPGPATGLPTRTEQGDLGYAIHGGHGEFPRAVLSAVSHEDAFYRLNKAFELADKYQIPVIFLSDQNFADTHRSIPPFDFSPLNYNRYLARQEEEPSPYKRYRFTESGISPRALPGQMPGEVVLVDSDEHDEKGNIIEDEKTRRLMMEKRMKKMDLLAQEMDEPELYGSSEGDILLLGWGSTYGVLREAVDMLNKEGIKAFLLHFTDLWPLPRERIKTFLPGAKKVFCVENNATGQLASLIHRETNLEVEHKILKYDGRPFFPGEIIQEVKKHV